MDILWPHRVSEWWFHIITIAGVQDTIFITLVVFRLFLFRRYNALVKK